MSQTKRIVIDANVGVIVVLSYPLSVIASHHWKKWIETEAEVCAPSLWLNEVTSAIHKVLHLGAIKEQEAVSALDAALQLEVDPRQESPELCRNAFRWATRLSQVAAYDGFYLALAEQLGSPLWTGDQRLVRRTRQLGVDWVRWIGEAPD